MGGSSGGPIAPGNLGGDSDDRRPGGGGGSGGGGDSSSGGDDCVIQFVARIHGPVPGRADVLRIGDVLRVVRIDGPPVQLGLFDSSDERVGSLAGQRELTRILDCIEAGNSYVAEVQSSSGSMISVQVRNA